MATTVVSDTPTPIHEAGLIIPSSSPSVNIDFDALIAEFNNPMDSPIYPDYPDPFLLSPIPKPSMVFPSLEALTRASEVNASLSPSSVTVPSVYPHIPIIVDPSNFIYPEFKFKELPAVPNEWIADFAVLPQERLDQLNKLQLDIDFDGYHPWEKTDENPIHKIIDLTTKEIASKFPKTCEGFYERIKICEKAINEIENLPTLDSHSKKLLEIGLRQELFRYMVSNEQSLLANAYMQTQKIPYDVEQISQFLKGFETRGHYLPKQPDFNVAAELLYKVNTLFSGRLCKQALDLNLTKLLPQDQFITLHLLIRKEVQRFAEAPLNHFLMTHFAHQALTCFFIEKNAPLFKEQFENGIPFPCNLDYILLSLLQLQTNFGNYPISEERNDSRFHFLQQVYGSLNPEEIRSKIVANIEAEIRQIQNEPVAQPSAPLGFFSRLFYKAPNPQEVERQHNEQKELKIALIERKGDIQDSAIASLQDFLEETTSHEDLAKVPDQLQNVLIPALDEKDFAPLHDEDFEIPILDDSPFEEEDSADVINMPSSHNENPHSTPDVILNDFIIIPEKSLTPEGSITRRKLSNSSSRSSSSFPDAPAISGTTTPLRSEADLLFAAVMEQEAATRKKSALSASSAEPRTYIDLAFPHLLHEASGDIIYHQLSKQVQRDVIRHLFLLGKFGQIESKVDEAFKERVAAAKAAHVNILYDKELKQLNRSLKKIAVPEDKRCGEELLELYYQAKFNTSAFKEKLDNFPVSKLFLWQVWDQAKKNGVKMPEDDHNWAENNYKKVEHLHLTMQALERYLHT